MAHPIAKVGVVGIPAVLENSPGYNEWAVGMTNALAKVQ